MSMFQSAAQLCVCQPTLCLDLCPAVKMVTGDQQLIGIETTRQLGMGTDIHKIEVLLQVRFVAALMSGQCWPQGCL